MSEVLLSRQGPLGPIWLASNYDKKLTKTQLLNTNLVSSSRLLQTKQIQPSTSSSEDSVTLKLSGQLLLGIVRIYSRKTKYLLDDINEVLQKLRNSFRFASGATLGSSDTSNVNLAPNQTTISNVSRILLQDQVTELDLFQQEALVLEDDTDDAWMNEDRSIEVGRDAMPEEDDDIDLDLDFNLDDSIEQGRDAGVALPDEENSLFDIQPKSSGLDVLNEIEPLETVEDLEISEEPRRPRRQTGITETGQLRSVKRRITMDDPEEVERGIPISVIREIQNSYREGRLVNQYMSFRLTTEEKLRLLEELADPNPIKKRRLWNVDDVLRYRAEELAAHEELGARDIASDLDVDVDFDLSLPEVDDSSVERNEDEDEEGDAGAANLKDTIHVAELLKESFFETPSLTFDQLVKMDQETLEPLGMSIRAGESRLNERREASKCFYELLSLATQDCISLEQKADSITNLWNPLTIRPRDNLVNRTFQ